MPVAVLTLHAQGENWSQQNRVRLGVAIFCWRIILLNIIESTSRHIKIANKLVDISPSQFIFLSIVIVYFAFRIVYGASTLEAIWISVILIYVFYYKYFLFILRKIGRSLK